MARGFLVCGGALLVACGSDGASSGDHGVAISPPSATVVVSGLQAFTCTVDGAPAACTWSVEEADGGTITAGGAYTAPATNGVYHVVATAPGNASESATAPIVVPLIGNCDALPAVGVWEDITPAAFTMPANQQSVAIAIDPQHPNVLFAAAGNITNGPGCPMGQTCAPTGTGVYTSTDCGKSFTALSMGPSSAFANGDLWSIRIDPLDPTIMYTMNGYGGPPTLFQSTDSGATWTNLFSGPQFTTSSDHGGTFQYGGFVRSFDLEAANPSHVVVAFHEDCHGPVAAQASDAIDGAVMCFAESHDAGATWTIDEGPIPPASADGGAFTILGPNALIYTNSGSPTGTGWFTNDPDRNASSWTPIFTYDKQGPFTALNQAGGYFAPDGTFSIGGSNGIYFTSPGAMFGQQWTQIPGSPGAIIVGGDGRTAEAGGTLFVSSRNPVTPITSAPLGPSGPFTSMDAATQLHDSAQTFTYDPTHHILYAAGWSDGLWRVVTY